jgi:long-chain acyl-CoA synthetase
MELDHLGFWPLARRQPDRLALVAPDGEELTFGELAARANRIAHGLRAVGLRTGDAVAYALPNSAEAVALCLACLQTGRYVVPLNTHLVGPEVAYILGDSEAKVIIGHERLATVCAAAADEVDLPARYRFAVGDAAGFRSLDELTGGQPDTRPVDRALGSIMNYTAGTTGRPKGVRRP